ncbi:MAG: hypothetical protein ACXADY_24100 [Candidatus Hodarchaeales archaeon]|jgi:hypothetical protein
MDKHSNFKTIIIFGLIITIIGISIHICCPTELDSAHFYLESEEVYVKHFKLEKTIIDTTYQLHLRVNFPPNYNGTDYSNPNTIVLLLNETEYLKVIDSSIDLDELVPITTMEILDDPSEISLKLEGSYQFAEGEPVILYLLISSEQIEPLIGNYYLGISPPTYYLGIIIVVVGLVIVITPLIYWFSDWKRYLTFGIGVNLFIFLFRVLTIGKYNSIGMQSSFFGDLITPEMYNDFEFWYMSWIDPFLKGAFPYESLYTPTNNQMFLYQMPPLYIITIGLFGLIPLFPIWKIAIPIFLSHITTGIMVFLLSRNILGYNENASTKAMLFYYLNPISLIYASFCWFNPPIFVFFGVFAFYLITTENRTFKITNISITSYDLALIALGIGTLYKQFAAIFFPLVIITIIKQKNITDKKDIFTNIIRCSIIYFIPILIIILPFIAVDYAKFVDATLISTTEFGIWWTKNINYSFPVNFNTFFVNSGLPVIITDIIGFLIAYWILLGISAVLIYLVFWFDFNKFKYGKHFQKRALFYWVLILVICVHLFYPRGSFKFYLILLVPFLSLNLDIKRSFATMKQPSENPNSIKNRKWFLSSDFVVNFLLLTIIVLIYRYIYFMILLGWLIYLYSKKRQSEINNAVYD